MLCNLTCTILLFKIFFQEFLRKVRVVFFVISTFLRPKGAHCDMTERSSRDEFHNDRHDIVSKDTGQGDKGPSRFCMFFVLFAVLMIVLAGICQLEGETRRQVADIFELVLELLSFVST